MRVVGMIRSTILLVILSAAFVSNTSAEQQTSLKTRAAEATPHYETLPQNIPSEGLKKRRPHSESRHPLRELASRSAHSYSRSANRRTQSRGDPFLLAMRYLSTSSSLRSNTCARKQFYFERRARCEACRRGQLWESHSRRLSVCDA